MDNFVKKLCLASIQKICWGSSFLFFIIPNLCAQTLSFDFHSYSAETLLGLSKENLCNELSSAYHHEKSVQSKNNFDESICQKSTLLMQNIVKDRVNQRIYRANLSLDLPLPNLAQCVFSLDQIFASMDNTIFTITRRWKLLRCQSYVKSQEYTFIPMNHHWLKQLLPYQLLLSWNTHCPMGKCNEEEIIARSISEFIDHNPNHPEARSTSWRIDFMQNSEISSEVLKLIKLHKPTINEDSFLEEWKKKYTPNSQFSFLNITLTQTSGRGDYGIYQYFMIIDHKNWSITLINYREYSE